MPFWMKNGFDPRNSVSRGGGDPRRGGGILWEKCLTSLIPLIIANWTDPCSGTRHEQTLHCKRWTSLLSAAMWGWDCTPRAKSEKNNL